MTLGEKLQKLRTEAAMSQEDLADCLGVSRQAISKWELDKTVPDVKYIVELSNLFRVSTDYLLKNASSSEKPLPFPGADTPLAAAKSHDRSSLISALLFCGDLLLFVLILLHFIMLFFFTYRITLIPLFLVLVFAPILLGLSRFFLRPPASHLRAYRHAGAACMSLWGLAIAVILGYNEVVDDLLFSMVEGPVSIPLFLCLTAALLGGMYAAAYLLMRWITRSIND